MGLAFLCPILLVSTIRRSNKEIEPSSSILDPCSHMTGWVRPIKKKGHYDQANAAYLKSKELPGASQNELAAYQVHTRSPVFEVTGRRNSRRRNGANRLTPVGCPGFMRTWERKSRCWNFSIEVPSSIAVD